MEIAEGTRRARATEFEAEALRFLPNVARYARLLMRDASDADDLVQETFLRAYEHWDQFRRGSDCRKWLFAICRNVYLRDHQRAQRFVAVDDPDADVQATRELYDTAVADGLDSLFDRVDVRPALERGLDALQPEYRAAVIIVDVEDRSYAEAAELLGVPIGTVRSRLYRARRLLQASLIEYARDLGLAAVRREETAP